MKTLSDKLQNGLTNKISISAKLIPCLSYGILAFGVLLSSILIFIYFYSIDPTSLNASTPALRLLANTGMPATAMLYTGVFFGSIGVVLLFGRQMVDVEKETPAAFLYIPSGISSLLTGTVYWAAMTIIIDMIIPGRLAVETDLGNELTKAFILFGLSIVLALISLILVFYAVFSKATKSAGRSFAPLITVFVFQCLMIYFMFGNQYRTWWLLSAGY